MILDLTNFRLVEMKVVQLEGSGHMSSGDKAGKVI